MAGGRRSVDYTSRLMPDSSATSPTAPSERLVGAPTGGDGSLQSERVIPVIQEVISVRRDVETTGHVRITKHVDTEELEVDLESVTRSFDVERRPVGRLLDEPPPAVRRDGDQTLYSVVREVPVVVTRYEVVEELVVTPRETRTPQTEQVERRAERVEVERTAPPQTFPST